MSHSSNQYIKIEKLFSHNLFKRYSKRAAPQKDGGETELHSHRSASNTNKQTKQIKTRKNKKSKIKQK